MHLEFLRIYWLVRLTDSYSSFPAVSFLQFLPGLGDCTDNWQLYSFRAGERPAFSYRMPTKLVGLALAGQLWAGLEIQ